MELKDISDALVVNPLFRTIITDSNIQSVIQLVKNFIDSRSSQMFGTIDGLIENEIAMFSLNFGYTNYPCGDFIEVIINLHCVSSTEDSVTLYDPNPMSLGRVVIPRNQFN